MITCALIETKNFRFADLNQWQHLRFALTFKILSFNSTDTRLAMPTLPLVEPAPFDHNQYVASDSPDRIFDDTTCALVCKYTTFLVRRWWDYRGRRTIIMYIPLLCTFLDHLINNQGLPIQRTGKWILGLFLLAWSRIQIHESLDSLCQDRLWTSLLQNATFLWYFFTWKISSFTNRFTVCSLDQGSRFSWDSSW